jgi:hypothetical protein
MLTIYDQIRELRAELAATSCARGRAQAEEDLKRLIAEQAKFDRAFDVAEKRRPSLVGRSRLDPSPRRCSPHAPTSPRRHARSQLVALCRASTRSKGDPNHCAIAAYHGSWERPDNGSADWFWRRPPKRTHPISKCQPGQETTPAKSALRGVPHHTTRRGRRLHPPAGQRRTYPPEPSLSGHGEALR